MNILEHFENEYRIFGLIITKPPNVLIENDVALRNTVRGTAVMMLYRTKPTTKPTLVKIAEYDMTHEALRIRFALRPSEVACLAKETDVRLAESMKSESGHGMRSVIRTQNWLAVSQYAELLRKITDAHRYRGV